mgnify:CR=1 FL=1
MPQVWATHPEIAAALGETTDAVRRWAAASRLPSRRCSDGLIRVKLPQSVAAPVLLAAFDFRRDLLAAVEADMRRAAPPVAQPVAQPVALGDVAPEAASPRGDLDIEALRRRLGDGVEAAFGRRDAA